MDTSPKKRTVRFIIKVETKQEGALLGYVSKNLDKPSVLTPDADYALSFADWMDACEWAAFYWHNAQDAILHQTAQYAIVARQ